jgi:hypothetical protein
MDDYCDDVQIRDNMVVRANWGLHLVDVNLAMGNLVDIVGQQARVYAKK